MCFRREFGQTSLLFKIQSSSSSQNPLQGRATSTVKKYSGAYNRRRVWANTKPEIALAYPHSPYLNFLAQKAKTSAPIIEAVSALLWVNQIATVEDTTIHPLVVQVLVGIKRKLACATTRKEPITQDILSTLVSRFGQQDAPLADIHTYSGKGKASFRKR